MRKKVGSLEEIINYGINNLDSESNISLTLKDFIFIYRTIEELRRFLHNEDHYPDLNTVHKFIGNNKSGMLNIINKIYGDILNKALTEDIENILESDLFHSNLIPFYYNYNPDEPNMQ
jgi:hypothetical protein